MTGQKNKKDTKNDDESFGSCSDLDLDEILKDIENE